MIDRKHANYRFRSKKKRANHRKMCFLSIQINNEQYCIIVDTAAITHSHIELDVLYFAFYILPRSWHVVSINHVFSCQSNRMFLYFKLSMLTICLKNTRQLQIKIHSKKKLQRAEKQIFFKFICAQHSSKFYSPNLMHNFVYRLKVNNQSTQKNTKCWTCIYVDYLCLMNREGTKNLLPSELGWNYLYDIDISNAIF